MSDSEMIHKVLYGTIDENFLEPDKCFNLGKKRAILKFFNDIGLNEERLTILGRCLQKKHDFVPSRYLNYAEETISESFGKLIHKYRWLLYEYTQFPYSPEESARLIKESIDKIADKYHPSSLVIYYTTKINPDPEKFNDLLTIGSFSTKDYGMIDIIGGTLLLLKEGKINVNFFEMLRANNEFLEFRIVFELKNEKNSKPSDTKKDNEGKLIINYDDPEPFLEYCSNKLLLNSTSIEFFILKELFLAYPKEALEMDIIESWACTENEQTLYDACRRLNKKLEGLTSIDAKPIHRKNGKLWFDERYKQIIITLTKTDKN